MKVIPLCETDYLLYEKFLLSDENTLIYYSIKYKLFLEKLLNCTPEYWVVKEGNDILGVLPLMSIEGKYGKVYNSLPFYGSNGGIIARDEKIYKILLDKYNELISESNVLASNFIENPLYHKNIDNSNIISNESDYRTGHFTPLSIDIKQDDTIEDVLMSSLHYKTRNTIRKPIKSGVDVFCSTDKKYLDFLKIVHNENMEKIGGKAKEDLFFDLVPSCFEAEKDYKIFVAEKDGEIISALLLLYYNNTVEYFTPVIKEEYRTFQPLSLLIFKGMLDGINNKYKFWNWGGTGKSQEGVFKFKSRWNTKNIDYKYYIQVNNEDIYKLKREELLEQYPNFYVLPFNLLKSTN